MTWEPLPDRDSTPRELGSVLGRLHTTMGLARPDTLAVLERHWTAILGADLAPLCALEAIRGTEMVIAVDDPAIAEHLRWSARDLCAAVNAVCDGEVVDQLTVKVRRTGS